MSRVFFAVFTLFASSALSQVTQTPSFQEGAFKFINTFNFYSTTENFVEDGSKVALASGDEFSNWTADLALRYGYSRRVELYGGLRFSNASSISSQVERTKSGLTDIHVGGFYRWREGALSIFPGVHVSYPMVSNAVDTDSVLLNDGAYVLGVPIYADYKMRAFAAYGQLMPAMMGDGRGARYYFSAGAKKRLGNFILNLEIAGMNQIGDDEFTDTPTTRTDVTTRVNGGSLRYFSVNPGLMQVALQARMRLSKEFIAGLGYSKDISGVRTSAGSSIITYLEMRIKGTSSFANQNSYRSYYVEKRKKKKRRRSRSRRRAPEPTQDEVETVYVDEDGAVIPTDEIPPEVLYGENVDFQSNFEETSEDKDLIYFENADPTRPQPKRKKRRSRRSQKSSSDSLYDDDGSW